MIGFDHPLKNRHRPTASFHAKFLHKATKTTIDVFGPAGLGPKALNRRELPQV